MSLLPPIPFPSNQITVSNFLQMIGSLDLSRKSFKHSIGGGPDPDSFRGFGATSCIYSVPTSNGWTVTYNDNESFADGVRAGVGPDGSAYRLAVNDENRHVFVDKNALQAWWDARNKQMDEYYAELGKKNPGW